MTDTRDPRTRLCLASHSPRRRALLERLGVHFFVQAAAAEVEDAILGQGRGDEADRVALDRARAKGLAVAQELSQTSDRCDAPVLSADTVVHLGSEILDKPADADQARDFLQRLSGRQHGVVTGVWMLHRGVERTVWRRTLVEFGELSASMMEAYIATGEPFDKAGGYGIQGIGGTLVSSIGGCYFNVMGLPLRDTALMLTEAGVPWALQPTTP
jgi:nucleoside triphosphate pyrophosphatase